MGNAIVVIKIATNFVDKILNLLKYFLKNSTHIEQYIKNELNFVR